MLAVELMGEIIGAIIRPTRLRSSRGIGQWVTWLLQSSWLRSRDSSYVIVQTVDHYCPFEYFLNFWVQILEKEMMHGKSGNTVNRELTVVSYISSAAFLVPSALEGIFALWTRDSLFLIFRRSTYKFNFIAVLSCLAFDIYRNINLWDRRYVWMDAKNI